MSSTPRNDASRERARLLLHASGCSTAATRGPGQAYRPRQPQETVLYRVLPEQVETSLDDLQRDGRAALPGSLHADVAVGGKSRTRLEHLFRYVARGPLSNERLSLREDGKLELRLKTPWRDGTNAVLFTPHEMIEKLIAIIPPPRFNQVRYHGVFAPTHRWRQHVINDRRPPYAPPKADPDAEKYAAAVPRRGRNYSRAELMRRVWDADVLECERCQGRMRVIAALTTPEAIRAVLGALGMPTEPPVVAPPRRGPPEPQLDWHW